jgi:hypothetical protein
MKTAWTGLAFIQKRTPFFCFTVPEVWASNGKKSPSVCQLAGLTAPSEAEDHGSCAPADPVSAGLQSSIAKGNHSHAGAATAWRIGASSNPLSNVVSRKRKKSYCVWAAAVAMTTFATSPRVHWRTYERLCLAHDVAEGRSIRAVTRPAGFAV